MPITVTTHFCSLIFINQLLRYFNVEYIFIICQIFKFQDKVLDFHRYVTCLEDVCGNTNAVLIHMIKLKVLFVFSMLKLVPVMFILIKGQHRRCSFMFAVCGY